MRVLIIDTCYPAFLTNLYLCDPGLKRLPYAEQWRALMDTFFGTADSYSYYLSQLGHDAHEVVANAEPLQRAWAEEHDIRRPLAWRLLRRAHPELIVEQVESFEPDVVYVQDLGFLSPQMLAALKSRTRLLVGQIASEPPERAHLEQFDLILTSLPHFVPMFRDLGIDAEYFRIGFDPRVLDRLERTEARYGAVFVGALGRLQHARGNDRLEKAARRVPIDFWGYWGYKVRDQSADSPIIRRYHGEAWGLNMFRVLAEARIAVNRHIDIAGDNANNMRLYEATGVGALLVTDAKSNLGELFEVGREVVAYSSEDELVEAITYYLAHEPERRAIAESGQRRTLADHTYEARMRELVEVLETRL